MNVSINPSYFCNFNCSFCYLTPEQLRDKKIASLVEIETKLQEIFQGIGRKIEQIDLYGGEIALLDESYLGSLLSIVEKYAELPCNLITNLSKPNKIFDDPRVQLSVSYDFEARQLSDVVFNNMALTNKDIAVLILASADVLKMNVEELIKKLNLLQNITSVEIKPYSTNQSNDFEITFSDFEDFIKNWIDAKTEKKFLFINEEKIKESLSSSYNAFSDDHIYITPNGKLGVLEFDSDDNELFYELDNFDEYKRWAKKEKEKVKTNEFCASCNYFGNCLTEHYREVKSLDRSCNGFKKLLDWYHESIT